MQYGGSPEEEEGRGRGENKTECRPTEGGIGWVLLLLKRKDLQKKRRMGSIQSGPQWIWSGNVSGVPGQKQGWPSTEPKERELRRGSGLETLTEKETAAVCPHNKEKGPILPLTPFKPNHSSLKQWGT